MHWLFDCLAAIVVGLLGSPVERAEWLKDVWAADEVFDSMRP